MNEIYCKSMMEKRARRVERQKKRREAPAHPAAIDTRLTIEIELRGWDMGTYSSCVAQPL